MTTRTTQHPIPAQSTKKRTSLFFVALLILVSSIVPLAGAAWADGPSAGFVVIVHPNNSTLEVTRDFLAQAFLKRLTRWPDGETIRPTDLYVEARARTQFSGLVLKRSVAAVRSYWQQRIFSGRELPPPEFDSEEAVVRYVLSSPGAIGYVSPTANIQNAKVLRVR